MQLLYIVLQSPLHHFNLCDFILNKAVVDIKRRHRCCPWRVTLSIRPIGVRVAFAWPIVDKCYVIVKPEIHNMFRCRQRRTEPRPQLTRTDNFVKFERVTRDVRADRHTHRHTHTLVAILRTPPGTK